MPEKFSKKKYKSNKPQDIKMSEKLTNISTQQASIKLNPNKWKANIKFN